MLGTTLQIARYLESFSKPSASCKVILRQNEINSTNNRWASFRSYDHTRSMWLSIHLKQAQDMLHFSRHAFSHIMAAMSRHCLVGLNIATNDIGRTCWGKTHSLLMLQGMWNRVGYIRLHLLQGANWFNERY